MIIKYCLIRNSLWLAVAYFACLCTSNTCAELIQFTFTGEVTEIGGELWDPWLDTQLGDSVTVQYIVDSNAEDQIPGGDIGQYSPLELMLSIGTGSQYAQNSYIVVSYDYLLGAPDGYLPSYHFAGGSLGNAFVVGTDLFTSDELPTNVDWAQNAYDAGGWLYSEPSSSSFIEYELTQFESVVVPAAPTVFALCLGTLFRRRRHS